MRSNNLVGDTSEGCVWTNKSKYIVTQYNNWRPTSPQTHRSIHSLSNLLGPAVDRQICTTMLDLSWSCHHKFVQQVVCEFRSVSSIGSIVQTLQAVGFWLACSVLQWGSLLLVWSICTKHDDLVLSSRHNFDVCSLLAIGVLVQNLESLGLLLYFSQGIGLSHESTLCYSNLGFFLFIFTYSFVWLLWYFGLNRTLIFCLVVCMRQDLVQLRTIVLHTALVNRYCYQLSCKLGPLGAG